MIMYIEQYFLLILEKKKPSKGKYTMNEGNKRINLLLNLQHLIYYYGLGQEMKVLERITS